MNKELFKKLQKLIVEDKVLIEVSRTFSSSAFGGAIGCIFFTFILMGGVVGIIMAFIKKLVLYAVLGIVGIIVFWIIWEKVAFYYFYIRSGRNFEFFQAAYITKMIRLRAGEKGNIVAYPTPWTSIFDIVKD